MEGQIELKSKNLIMKKSQRVETTILKKKMLDNVRVNFQWKFLMLKL